MNTTTGKTAKAAREDRTRECGCGCGAAVAKGSRFLPGHDARLKSRLVAAAREGDAAARAELERRGWLKFAEPTKAMLAKAERAAAKSRRLYTEEQAAEVDRLIAQDAEAEGAA